MDNQLVQSHVWLSRLFSIIIAVVLIIGISILGVYWRETTDPYAHEVLSLEGDAKNGLDIFQINCAGCHSLRADAVRSPGRRGPGK